MVREVGWKAGEGDMMNRAYKSIIWRRGGGDGREGRGR
jgi:hypothetical protein